MRLSDLPNENDATAIFKFAMSFDGYVHFGLFEASAAASASSDRSSLELIRNELFFAARASRHNGGDEFVSLYSDLLPLLKRYATDL